MTEEPLLIRGLTAGDVAAAVALEHGTPGAWSEEALAAELLRPGGWQYIGLSRANSAPLCRTDRKAQRPLLAHAPSHERDYRVVQMHERGLSAIHQVCGQADDKADAPPCNLLPVCYACGHVVDQEAELYRIAVTANRRQQGIGTLFLRSLLHSLTNYGITSCWLEVRASNTAAISLYLKVGFTRKGARKKYYADPPEDAIIMQWIAKTSCNADANR